MADQYSYLAYKQDQRRLTYWMLQTSNSIIKTTLSKNPNETTTLKVNTNGKLEKSSLLPTSKLIAKHVKPVPSLIYRLFQSVISARRAFSSFYQQMIAGKPDAEIEAGNASHQHFIDVLTACFEALGGKAWQEEQRSGKEIFEEEEDDVEVLFANYFAALVVDSTNAENGGENTDEEENETPSMNAGAQNNRRARVKGKRGKKGKKGKGKPTPTAKEASLDDIPMESYRIIDDEFGIITDYLMAVYAIIRQWCQLREHIQGLWREVAYGGLNSATAGTLSNMAISMIKRTEVAIFVEFPGDDSYTAIMNTITRGNIEKSQGNYHLDLHEVSTGTNETRQVIRTDLDVREQFFIHAYDDLLAFIHDFQKTRSGKPTKAMLSQIRDWDPNFQLQKASKEERIKWRRSYTINWLYDLVNVFSAIVIQRIKVKGEKHILENVDWSPKGPWNQRRLFGLNEFAGGITALAFQKEGTDIRKRIKVSTIFQLQLIIDSLTVFKGWSPNSLQGHILIPPPSNFYPQRDINLFLDRKYKRMGQGLLQGIQVLTQVLKQDSLKNGSPTRHFDQLEVLEELNLDFLDWLGECKYQYGFNEIPPSRFSSTNPNGLWDYSPYLCGVGLMESLELIYSFSLALWDQIPEPICIIHLHNMLVQKKYIKKPIGLYGSLEAFFPFSFYANGKPPTSPTNFQEALTTLLNKTGSRREIFERESSRRNIKQTQKGRDIHNILNPINNRFFKQKSLLNIYREAEWDVERISDEDVRWTSMLGGLRLMKSETRFDKETGKRVLVDTVLIKKARKDGMDDEEILKMNSHFLEIWEGDEEGSFPNDMLEKDQLERQRGDLAALRKRGIVRKGKKDLDDVMLLSVLKRDIDSDICGDPMPLSAINYIWATIRFMMFWDTVERQLERLGNVSWKKVNEEQVYRRERRASLTVFALGGEDEELLRVITHALENPRSGILQNLFWEELETMEEVGREGRDPINVKKMPTGGCNIM